MTKNYLQSFNEFVPDTSCTISELRDRLGNFESQKLSDADRVVLKDIEEALTSNTGTELVAMQEQFFSKLEESKPGITLAAEKLTIFVDFISHAMDLVGIDVETPLFQQMHVKMDIDPVTGLQGISQFVMEFNRHDDGTSCDKMCFTYICYPSGSLFAAAFLPGDGTGNVKLNHRFKGGMYYTDVIELDGGSTNSPSIFTYVEDGLKAFSSALPKDRLSEILIKN